MLSRIRISALLFGLVLAGPAAALDPVHPSTPMDVSTLAAESDFTVFMRKEVPENVRRAALRRLWALMRLPVFCHELCYEPEPAASDLAQLTGEKRIAAAE